MEDLQLENVGGRCIIKPANNSVMAHANAILNHSRFGIGGSSFRMAKEATETDSVPFGAFHRTILEKVGGMREDLPRGEDNEINSRIRKAGYKVWFDPKIISTYYARPTLRSSARQMYGNGIVFLLSIPLTLGLSLVVPCFLVAILADFRLSKDEGWRYFFPLLVLFPVVHLSYGWGTIKGFFYPITAMCIVAF